MADVTLYGAPNSTFVRTARLGLEEKGVPYDLVPTGKGGLEEMKGAEHLARHPFGKIPALTHGEVNVFESTSICRYVDEAFNGPMLQPEDFLERIRMEQWISAGLHYIRENILKGFVLQYAFPKGPDGQPDMDAIEAGKPLVRRDIDILERALDGRTFMAGETMTIADCLLVPILHYVGATPGGLSFVEGKTNIARWWEAVSSRPSFTATLPPSLAEAAE